jgi:hypothetical protein
MLQFISARPCLKPLPLQQQPHTKLLVAHRKLSTMPVSLLAPRSLLKEVLPRRLLQLQ